MRPPLISRREALGRFGAGFGSLALGSLLAEQLLTCSPLGAAGAPRATSVIQLFMHGGPSHVDLLDPKPVLKRLDGQAPPDEVAKASAGGGLSWHEATA